MRFVPPWAAACSLLTLGACSFAAPGAATDGEIPGDGADGPPRDGSTGTPDACATFSTQFDTCDTGPLGGPVTITGTISFDTSNFTVTGTNLPPVTVQQALFRGHEVALVVTPSLTLAPDARILATGRTPLAFLVYGDATFGARSIVDLAAGGAGARELCPNPPVAGAASSGGGAGGGAGGFGAAGGNGSEGDSDGGHSAGGRGGKQQELPGSPTGGCPGASGGKGADNGAPPGPGGGAFYLAASGTITMAPDAVIDVGGQGGGGGTAASWYGDAGGGGAGSGGMIWLEGTGIMGGVVVANGGGGGQGSGGGSRGDPGETGTRAGGHANGGRNGDTSGAAGGSGGWRDAEAGGDGAPNGVGGGGGGGGGVGYIRVRDRGGTPTFVLASPNPSLDNF